MYGSVKPVLKALLTGGAHQLRAGRPVVLAGTFVMFVAFLLCLKTKKRKASQWVLRVPTLLQYRLGCNETSRGSYSAARKETALVR